MLDYLHNVGGAFTRLADSRPFNTCHYARNVFDPNGVAGTHGALMLAVDLTDRQHSIALENVGIEVLSAHQLCANTKNKDGHNNYY